jgi:hypothetical protein
VSPDNRRITETQSKACQTLHKWLTNGSFKASD